MLPYKYAPHLSKANGITYFKLVDKNRDYTLG